MHPKTPPRAEASRHDLLVIGAGAAGLTAALTAAEQGARVLMLTKGHAPDSSSWHAQGGIAGAVGDDDTAALHAVDTERAGRDLCRASAVMVLVREGPERVRELIAMGVPFDPELNLEGGPLAPPRVQRRRERPPAGP